MRTNRLEAFSDGVFAIAITLLILDIRIPDVTYAALAGALWSMLPRLAAYILSFAVIGLYWIFHYIYIDRIKVVDGTLIGLNMLMLLFVSFMPIPTGLIGRYPLQPWPIVLYGACLFAMNMIGVTVLLYLRCHPQFVHEKISHRVLKRQLRVYLWVNVPYLVATIIAFRLPVVSYLVFFIILVGVGLNLWRELNAVGQKQVSGHIA